MKKWIKGLVLSWAPGLVLAAPVHLDTIEVEGQQQAPVSQTQSHDQYHLQQNTSGDNLGDYLDSQPLVESASYGQGVGRPVVKGLSGYQVKILQNDLEVSDLSAMSQDHAVAVMPKASQRIELLKGPASLLYGAHAGGAVKVVDNSSLDVFPQNGLHGEVETRYAQNNQALGLSGKLSAVGKGLALELSGHQQKTDDYQDGKGQTIQDSDVQALQGQMSLAYQVNDRAFAQIYLDEFIKDYGIPNQTSDETRIDMRQSRYGFIWNQSAVSEQIDRVKFELNVSDYLHDETEGSSVDGLFGQQTLNAKLKAESFIGDWYAAWLFGVQNSELKVCHEHGNCSDFSIAERTNNPIGDSFLQSRQGIQGWSHAHPMPNTQAQKFNLGTNWETEVSDGVLSWGAHIEYRDLKANPENIQQEWLVPSSWDDDYYHDQQDWAASLAIGWQQNWRDHAEWQINLSYLERLPSVDELYWNGFHHATDSYIFGNRDLKKEQALSVDWDMAWQSTDHQKWQANLFVTYFNNYIYQQVEYEENGDKLVDPFHLSDVWQTEQTGAYFWGAALNHSWQITELNHQALMLENQVDYLQAKLTSGGNLPRTAPMSWLIGLHYAPQDWTTKLQLKTVFKADQLAENEEATDGYQWLSLYLDWHPKNQYGHWLVWLKAENLLDEYAQNHLSFLKDTAPLMGRQLSLGAQLKF